jgi:hypothetical protein
LLQLGRKADSERVGGSKEKAQLAPGFPAIRDLELVDYITATVGQVRSYMSRRKGLMHSLLRRGNVKRKEWPGGNGVGNHHVKLLLALTHLTD